jgi:hypothetical protein
VLLIFRKISFIQEDTPKEEPVIPKPKNEDDGDEDEDPDKKRDYPDLLSFSHQSEANALTLGLNLLGVLSISAIRKNTTKKML